MNNSFKSYGFSFLFFLLSVGVFRGRLGSDDIEVFNAAFNFYQSGNFSDLQQTYVWKNRTIWFFLDLIIISLTNFILGTTHLEVISKFICGYSMTFFAFLGFALVFQYCQNKISHSGAYLAFTVVIFCTPILTLATGDGIESLIFLLMTLVITRDTYFSGLYGYLLFLIKFYHAPLILTMEAIKKNNKTVISLLVLIGVIIFYKYINSSETSSFPYKLILNRDYFTNLSNILFSIGAGFFFIWPLYIGAIILGWNKVTLLKALNIFVLLLFFSLFPFWHGQGPGTRYILPLMIIFLPEVVEGVNKIITMKRYKIIKFFVILYALLNLSTLEYRNTSIFEYRSDSAYSGMAYGVNDKDINFYEFNAYQFNPIIFSTTVTIYKVFGLNCKNSYVAVNCDAIYPRTLVSRIKYSIERSLPYTSFIKDGYLSKIILYLPYVYYLLIIFLVLFNYKNFDKKNEIN